MKIKKTNTAFTIIELLVVMVVIGVLATVSVATFGGNKEKARLGKIQAECTQYIQCEKATNICNQNGGSNCESLCDLSGLDCANPSDARTEYLAMTGGGGENGGGIGGGLGGQTCADLGLTCGAGEDRDACEYNSECASGWCSEYGYCWGYALGMGAEGDDCDFWGTTLECQAGLFCDYNTCEPIGDLLPAGASCEEFEETIYDSYFDRYTTETSNNCISDNCSDGVCVQDSWFYLADGEQCVSYYYNYHSECQSRNCDENTEVCAPVGTALNDENCSSGADCLSGQCLLDMACSNDNNWSCSSDDDCFNGGTCEIIGGSCYTDDSGNAQW